MEKSSFFNSVKGDRKYSAEDWASYFGAIIGNGVFPEPSNGLHIEKYPGMRIRIQPGKAWINGYFYTATASFVLSLNTASGSQDRIDRVVLRWDRVNREIKAAVKAGIPAATPAGADLQRDADIYELCLAEVYVAAGVTKIDQASITDKRLDSDLCGMVASLVEQLDTTAFNAQLEAWMAQYQAETGERLNLMASDMESWFAGQKVRLSTLEDECRETFYQWFNSLVHTMGQDEAAHLLELITENRERIKRLEENAGITAASSFSMNFDTLDKSTLTGGTWNKTEGRVEC